MKFADPTNDLAFKKIFGDENHKDILLSLLNSILDFKGNKAIVDVTLMSPYQAPKIEELKETILDIQATNESGEKFIVEMQNRNLGDFRKRSLYYSSKAYVEQLDKGYEYSTLKKVYFIGILKFSMFSNKEYISRHLIMNQETNEQDIEDFEFTFIELAKFKTELHQLESILEKWIYFIKHASNLSMIPKEYENIKEFKDAFNIATQTKWKKDEMRVYDYMGLKAYDEIHAMDTAVKEGEERGEKRGEDKKAIEIAKNSILQGLDNKTVLAITGLSEEMIESLRQEEVL